MIKVEDISKVYGKGEDAFYALKNISFEIPSGKVVAIVGKSGSGKSTLMHALSGLDRADSGDVVINGRNINKMKPSEVNKFRNKEMGFIFQTFFMQPYETVLDNVMMPLEIEGMPYKKRKEIATEALSKVELLDKATNKAVNLSGGQKQRVCIARAIVSQPKVLFADEPTGNLDSETGERIIKLLFDINKQLGSTLVIVTHDEEIAKRCDTKIFIKDGHILNIENN